MNLRLGDKGDMVRQIQRALTELGYKVAIDGDFGPKTEAAVEKFQRAHKLYVDGIAGRMTVYALNEMLPRDLQIGIPDISTDIPVPTTGLMTWVKCPADKVPNRSGYTFTTLREDVAGHYCALYSTTHLLGGAVTSAGGKRALASKAGPNRSKTSMHYVGRAFDMAVPTGMRDPATDQFVCVQVPGTRKWTVWCRSTLSESALIASCKAIGIQGGLMTLDGTYVAHKRILTKTVTCTAFDFTALARKHGFASISARKGFYDKADLMAAEWWHFQYTVGLVKGKSKFGEELLKVYTLEQAEKFVYWGEARGAVYGVSWF